MLVKYKTKPFLPQYPPEDEVKYIVTEIKKFCCKKFKGAMKEEFVAFGGYPKYTQTRGPKFYIFVTEYWDDGYPGCSDEATEEWSIKYCPFCGEEIICEKEE